MSFKLGRSDRPERSARFDRSTRSDRFGKSRSSVNQDSKLSRGSAKSSGKGNKRARNSYADGDKPRFFSGWKTKISLPGFGSFKTLLGILLCCVVGGAVLLTVALGSLHLYRYATTSPFFSTRQVDVVGNVRLSREMVLDLAGVHVGDNSLSVSIAKVERSLLGTPWVEDVSVKRLLPDRFMIKVHERMPSFWVRKDGVLYYADAKATIIAPVETSNFMSLPTLHVEPGAEDALVELERYLRDLKSGSFPVEFGAVSGITISPGKGLELYLEDREMRLSLAADDWEGNLERLGITLGDLARRNELASVREVRASDGNVWVIKSAQ